MSKRTIKPIGLHTREKYVNFTLEREFETGTIIEVSVKIGANTDRMYYRMGKESWAAIGHWTSGLTNTGRRYNNKKYATSDDIEVFA